MSIPLLRYDAENMFSAKHTGSGATRQELKDLLPKLKNARQTIIDQAESGQQGWLMLPDDTVMRRRIKKMATQKAPFETCVVIGIGGSDLGSRALYTALKKQGSVKQLVFAGATTDPDELHDLLEGLDLRKTLVNVISKSGDTLEPMATFLAVRSALRRVVGQKYADHIVVTTDERHGTLQDMAAREGFATLPVPANIGGRFSVLSDVGLFPLAWAGINIDNILKGAALEREAFLSDSIDKNASALFAGLQYLAYRERNQSIQILMPYAARLAEFGRWYRQLWAESLGKRVDRRGNVVHTGPTPIAAIGPTDQHSQLQLYVEGPNDKTVTFIEVDSFRYSQTVPIEAKDHAALAYLARLSFADLIHAQRQATAQSLRASERPNGTLHLAKISPEHLGALVMFFELAAAVSGELYEINTYDQPGVEAGKKLLPSLLKNPKTLL